MNAFHIIAAVMHGNTKVMSLAGHCCHLQGFLPQIVHMAAFIGAAAFLECCDLAPLDSFLCSVVSSELLQKFCPLIASGFASARVRSPIAPFVCWLSPV